MKTLKMFMWVLPVLAVLTGCSTVRGYAVSDFSRYDDSKGMFVPSPEKDKGVFIVRDEDLTLYSRQNKLWMKRTAEQKGYTDATYAEVYFMGKPCKLMTFTDDGYYNEGRVTFILYSRETMKPVFSFSLDRNTPYDKGMDVSGVFGDPEIVKQMDMASKIKTPRMYLFKKGL